MTMITYKPLEISQADVDIFNELILSKRLLGGVPHHPDKKLRFFQETDIAASSFVFSLNIDQEKMDIYIEPGLKSSLTQRLKDVGGIESVPEEFKNSIMAFCSREIIDILEYCLKLPITLWNSSQNSENSGEKKNLYFEVLGANSVSEARGKMSLSLPLLKRILSFASQFPIKERANFSQHLFDGNLIIGSTTLTLDDWNKLAPGDLIFLSEPSALSSGEGKFSIKKNITLPVLFDPKQFKPLVLTLEEMFPTGFKTNPPSLLEPTTILPEADKAFSLEITFSAGKVSLTLDEIIYLSNSKEIKNPIQVVRPLEILVQEELLGMGELVNISDHYAIVITQLNN